MLPLCLLAMGREGGRDGLMERQEHTDKKRRNNNLMQPNYNQKNKTKGVAHPGILL